MLVCVAAADCIALSHFEPGQVNPASITGHSEYGVATQTNRFTLERAPVARAVVVSVFRASSLCIDCGGVRDVCK